MKIIEILKHDHAKLRKDIQELLDMEVGHEAMQKAEDFTRFLTIHQRIEEDVLYPPLEKVSATKGKVLEGIQEHHVLDVLVKELMKLNPKDKMWTAKLTVIKEDLEHHLTEEEQDLFPKISNSLNKEILEHIANEALEIKKDAHIN